MFHLIESRSDMKKTKLSDHFRDGEKMYSLSCQIGTNIILITDKIKPNYENEYNHNYMTNILCSIQQSETALFNRMEKATNTLFHFVVDDECIYHIKECYLNPETDNMEIIRRTFGSK
jgi:hypothetical protein